MSKATKITVMISSRNNSKFQGKLLTNIREKLKDIIEEIKIDAKPLFDVWINEDQFPSSLEDGILSWSVQAVKEADIVIVLFNGEAGYVDTVKGETIGICHSELITAINTARGTTWGIELKDNKSSSNTVKNEDIEFQKYYQKQSICSKPVDNLKDLNKRVLEVIKDAVITLMKKGVTESIRSKGNSGQALDWKRLNYQKRKKEIIKAINSGFIKKGKNHFLEVNGKNILVEIDSIPDMLSIAKARESVGQPFLYEHKKADILDGSPTNIGIVHIIGCHKTVTENQARNILGFPDAMILKDSFGVYVADDTQKIQMVFIEKCLDESSTKSQLQLFTSWLNSTNEREEFIRRAESRKKIITIINEEMNNG